MKHKLSLAGTLTGFFLLLGASTAFAVYQFGQYQTSPAAITTSGQYALQLDSQASLNVHIQSSTAVSVANTSTAPLAYSFAYLASSTVTSTVKGTAGILHTFTIDTIATGSVITLYNSTSTASGQIIAQFTNPATSVDQGPKTATYDVSFTNGLVIQQTGNTSTITLSYQ